MSAWFVYIVRCADDTLYTGITTDVKARLFKHNAAKGAKYTRSRLPVRLLYTEQVVSKSAALVRESAVKKLSRKQKLQLVGQ